MSCTNKNQQDELITSKDNFLKAYHIGADEGWLALYLEAACVNLERIKNSMPEKLASFLWLFRADELDFKADKDEMVEMICDKITALRNCFAHGNVKKADENIFSCSHEFYVFLEGKLRSIAAQDCLISGGDSSVIAEYSLVRRIFIDKKFKYELTYAGVIFLCTLALYRDEAESFLSGLKYMKKGDLYSRELKRYFTYFSIRKKFQISGATDFYSLHFANIIEYLNKVPLVSMDYLSLRQERDRLAMLEAESVEFDANKKYKYTLRPRMREKFTDFALAYLEDFDLFPELRFKRLNVFGEGNGEYLYGRTENETDHADQNDTRMDRHFSKNREIAGFAWTPGSEHYGSIRISELRGGISRDILKKLVGLNLNAPAIYGKVRENMLEYLAAYHRLLEKILDFAAENSFYRLNDLMPELVVLIGNTPEELQKDFVKLATPVLGSALVRILCGEQQQNTADPCESLLHQLDLAIGQTLQFEKRLKTEKVRDNAKIMQVMDFFRIHSPGFPFRQLPVAKQHRACMDYEFQTVHELIGNYNRFPKKLWKHFEKFEEKKRDPKFSAAAKYSAEKIMDLVNERLTLLKEARPLKDARTLDELAMIAARECRILYKKARAILSMKDDPDYQVTLDRWQKLCGVAGPRKISQESVFETILKLKESEWKHAYDYEAGAKHSRRVAEVEHIVPQVTFPADMIERMLAAENVREAVRKNPNLYCREKDRIDFNRFFREMKTGISLRDYYDSSVLVQWLIDNAGKKSEMPVNTLKRNEVDSAVKKIREFQAQDKMLLKIAFLYFEKSHRKLEFTKDVREEKNVYEIFTTPIRATVGKIRYEVFLADRNKALYELLLQYLRKFADRLIAKCESPEQKIFSYQEMVTAFEAMRHEDNRIRRRFIAPLLRLEKKEGGTPAGVPADQHLHQVIPSITVQDAGKIIEFRNAVFHLANAALEKFDPENKIRPLLEECGCWEKEAADPARSRNNAGRGNGRAAGHGGKAKQKKPEVNGVYEGYVTRIFDWGGLLVRMDIGATGLVKNVRREYQLNDSVKVRVIKINETDKGLKIDLVLVG